MNDFCLVSAGLSVVTAFCYAHRDFSCFVVFFKFFFDDHSEFYADCFGFRYIFGALILSLQNRNEFRIFDIFDGDTKENYEQVLTRTVDFPKEGRDLADCVSEKQVKKEKNGKIIKNVEHAFQMCFLFFVPHIVNNNIQVQLFTGPECV